MKYIVVLNPDKYIDKCRNVYAQRVDIKENGAAVFFDTYAEDGCEYTNPVVRRVFQADSFLEIIREANE